MVRNSWRKPVESNINRSLVTRWTKALKQDSFCSWEALRPVCESSLSDVRDEGWEWQRDVGPGQSFVVRGSTLDFIVCNKKPLDNFWSEKWYNITTACKTAFSEARLNNGWIVKSLRYFNYACWRCWWFLVNWK